tara:strand:+ start:1409 stop:1846 length:438 start_codon:yes stop_codon:yes gene_type:complete
MLNKIVFLLMFSLNAFAIEANVPEGQFTIVEEGNPALFSGVLFNDISVAYILADKKFNEEEVQLQIGFALHKQRLKHQREINSLHLEYDILQEQTDLLIFERDKHISTLQEQLAKKPNSYKLTSALKSVIIIALASYIAIDKLNI